MAAELGLQPIQVRRFLRERHPRGAVEAGQRWCLTAEMADQVRAHFRGRSRSPLSVDPVFEVVGRVPDGEAVDSSGVTELALERLERLATWSPWLPFAEARRAAPTTPGVYLAREHASGAIVYVGMAGERRGKGLSGRIGVYASGKALASGLGEAVFDRALADAGWLAARLADVNAGRPARATEWGRLAFDRADVHIRWAQTSDGPSAVALERLCLDVLSSTDLWNRAR